MSSSVALSFSFEADAEVTRTESVEDDAQSTE